MRYENEKAYRLISPRILILVTTVDILDGIDAMPTTFVAPVSFKPPLVMVSIPPKSNTYDNILDKKEFVINVLPSLYVTKVLKCGKHFPKGFNKLQQAGLNWYSSEKVKVPRVKEAKIWLECRFVGGLQIDHLRSTDHVPMLGEVITAEVSDDVVTEGRVDMKKLSPAMHITSESFAVGFEIVKKKVA
ncbi:MAG: flavin reductase family protein [Candidatus Aenigmarchaeota archaeon]|nr:flavin reductase family protein [Candidatus Aenigmarchaeota archaeon]